MADIYFCRSRKIYKNILSSWQLLRMQERDMSLLKTMTGLEYEIRYADEAQGMAYSREQRWCVALLISDWCRFQTGIFVICKQIRETPDLAHPQVYYYVMHGTLELAHHARH